MQLQIKSMFTPELDPGFVPAVLWNREYSRQVKASGQGQPLVIALERSSGTTSTLNTEIFPHKGEYIDVNIKYVERMIKFLLWVKGGFRVTIAGCKAIADDIRDIYSAEGVRAFDFDIMGKKIYGETFEIVACDLADAPTSHEIQVKLGGNMNGCRIGFDLGGSDRKCAAVIDGKVVHTEEVEWDPYFEKDPEYHKQGIRDSLHRAAEKLPRVDAIGGSAAGVYVDNKPRIASLFRGVSAKDWKEHVLPVFENIQKEYNVPIVVANDGDVTALAGAISMESNGVLGVAMGTSEAVGYVNLDGNITDWLNELAFVPVDYRENGPVDEWSGDIGCGVQFFSQQAVARLAPLAGIKFADGMPFPEQLVEVQKLMAEGDERAAAIYRTIGVCFGYAIATYAQAYDIRLLLILGRVTSGKGGEIILEKAEEVLKGEFPELAEQIEFRTPDEKFKRHGQAVIAASLPSIA
ncbi:MAG: ROK family protein [Lentisphaerae bacterium]|nr:ROK family protein [Lentisphaerota bacterium]MCP4103464.1 ROK family protein [Lentisphaerota bacterium]